MKKLTILLIGLLCASQNNAMAAVVIKKAAPVSEQKTTATNDISTLLPTVINVVKGVKELKQTTKELTAECIPTNAQIEFVNKLMMEYARTGAKTADEIISSLRTKCCENTSYQNSLQIAADTNETDLICFDCFNEQGAIWHKYPKAVSTYYCDDGTASCSDKNKKYASNMYDIYYQINFSDEDLTKKEAETARIITNKIEECSSIKLNARKRALWSNFLTQTIGGIGQKTNTASIMEIVGQNANSGTQGIMNSLGGLATKFMGQ